MWKPSFEMYLTAYSFDVLHQLSYNRYKQIHQLALFKSVLLYYEKKKITIIDLKFE